MNCDSLDESVLEVIVVVMKCDVSHTAHLMYYIACSELSH